MLAEPLRCEARGLRVQPYEIVIARGTPEEARMFRVGFNDMQSLADPVYPNPLLPHDTPPRIADAFREARGCSYISTTASAALVRRALSSFSPTASRRFEARTCTR
jgi:hypothetical protein